MSKGTEERERQDLLPGGGEQPQQAGGSAGTIVPSGQSTLTLANQTFDQSVVLRQSPIWPRALTWTILGVISFAVVWSYFARIEQVVQATGQLKPVGKVKEIQAPVEGLIREVNFDDGETVEAGDILVAYDSDIATKQLASRTSIQRSLNNENSFYRQLMASETVSPVELETAIARLELPQEVAFLARNRTALLAENQLYRNILAGRLDRSMSREEFGRLEASLQESASRVAAARLEVEELQKQLAQVNVRLEDARQQLQTEEEILDELSPLLAEGAVARLQVTRQRQQMQERASQVGQLVEEKLRLDFAIRQAGQEAQNAISISRKDVYDRIGENIKQIAQIDSQLNKSIVENDKRLAEIASEIGQIEQQLDYQEVRAPISGTVFDMQAYPGFVASPSEVLLKIVPDDELVAEVFITNQDIGFVEPGQTVDVRIDTYSFSEYGDIKGTVIWIGHDALEPDEIYNFYRFPAKVELDAQELRLKEREIELGSGLAVNTNIKIRENRRVISLFLERFTTSVIEPLKSTD
ncbi:multidrug resistance efflux pump [Rubidibacter lacunae KORDI 51-2]|uniref:Multidrug resistance efflux pump n=1 Tax=Rubidibacter lacunae KORDI 51-2 TaxID=582515 RepID=U5DPD7_9CHRO|nr:HlyD family efflux transporter periplasmic adaptor subunit [Rubidibacter lacunae]ERN42469.1 multidrug resistance efflux pump [Rubidibacter lacunae KORDI 51-2]